MIIGRLSASCPVAVSARTATITGSWVGRDLRAVHQVGDVPLVAQLASGSVLDSAVAFDALRFAVGPDLGAASSSSRRSRSRGTSASIRAFPSCSARSTTDSSARKLFNAAFASTCVASTINWSRPAIPPHDTTRAPA